VTPCLLRADSRMAKTIAGMYNLIEYRKEETLSERFAKRTQPSGKHTMTRDGSDGDSVVAIHTGTAMTLSYWRIWTRRT
jgi:hypothetical protein